MGEVKLYIRYSDDEYHLPVAVAESPGELAQMTGFKKSIILQSIAKGRQTFGKVVIEEEDDDEGI